MSLLIKLSLAAVALYVAVAFAAYLGQRRLLYFPDTERVSPSKEGLAGVAERVLDTPDGARLIAWYGRARSGQPTILYFHGNGGGLVDRVPRIQRFMAEGWGVYMLSYRGYSGGTGKPSEANNVADAVLAYDALVKEGVSPASIVAYGESLGSYIAARIALEKPVAGIILDAPYTSVADVGTAIYPYLPVRTLLTDRYETKTIIGKVRVPVLILHGERDDLIPVAMGRALAAMANEPKRLVTFPKGEHSNLYVDGNNALAAVRDWMRGLKR